MKGKRGNNLCLWMVFCVFGFSLMLGCATTPKTLKTETTSNIKKLGVVAFLRDNELKVFDHTEVSKKTYGGFIFGAIGGALEGIAIAVETNIRIRSSLGGDPNILIKELGEYHINEILGGKLADKLSEKYVIVNTDRFVNELRETKKGQKLKIEDYLDVCRKCEADTMLKVDFDYGLAAYAREKASAAMIANISVYDVATKTLLMKKEIVSDNYFKRSRVIPDFAANGAELYKKDILEALNTLSVIVARDFGLNVAMPQVDQMSRAKKGFGDFPDEVTTISVTCNKPYKIEQDCSIWGGAKRTIKIKERKIRVAGSDDGMIILVMDKPFADDESVFACFELVREELLSKGISVVKVVKMVTRGKVRGCILQLDGDGYSILKSYSVD
jgi:hypothetical protein